MRSRADFVVDVNQCCEAPSTVFWRCSGVSHWLGLDAMTETLELKSIINKALNNARAAGFGFAQQIEHAVRSVRQVHPEIDESDAVTAVLRIRGQR